MVCALAKWTEDASLGLNGVIYTSSPVYFELVSPGDVEYITATWEVTATGPSQVAEVVCSSITCCLILR